jgi:hypothetical protein
MMRHPLAKTEGEKLEVRVLRTREGRLEALETEHGIMNVAPAYRDLSAEAAIAHTFGDHPDGESGQQGTVTEYKSRKQKEAAAHGRTIKEANEVRARGIGEVGQTLLNVVLHDNPHLRRKED